MKRNIAIALILLMNFNSFAFASSYLDNQLEASKKNKKYSSVPKYTRQYNQNENIKTNDIEIKDPKLLKIRNVESIDNKLFESKIKKDETIYKGKVLPNLKKETDSININPNPIDLYNLYRISEKIIRANNLDYVNWRVAVIKNTEEYNAGTEAGNLVTINTALYDSLCSNPDALAFVISHEFAHQILGHAQQIAELSHRTYKLQCCFIVIPVIGFIPFLILDSKERNTKKRIEYIADSLSIELLTRAGYDAEKAMEAVNIMNAIPHIETMDSTHPTPEKRIKNIEETKKYISQCLKDEGKYNIYNSEVLECQKSSDRISFVILQEKDKGKNTFYEPETTEELLNRIAYTDYKNGEMRKAINTFKKLTKVSDSYIPYLYISYAYEYLYKQENKEKFLKRAVKYAEKAQEIETKNKFIKKQLKELSENL